MKMFATSLTGKVQDIHGQIIINNNGLIETVVLGQVIPAGAKLQFNDNATLTLITDSNQRILLGGENQQILSETTTSSINSDIANVQVLISSSNDLIGQKKIIVPCSPIHSGGFEFVTLQRNGDELLAATDYSTSGQPQSISQSDELFNNAIRHEGLIAKVDNYTVAEDNKIILHLLDNDTSVSGDPLSIDSINGTPLTGGDQTIIVDHGHISIATDGTITFIPKSNFNGDVNVDYTVTDGTSIQGSHASIIVTPVNDAPVAMPDEVTTPEDTSITVDLTKNDSDIDGDKITVTDINGTPVTPGHEQTIVVDNGKIVIAHDGGMTFVPSDNYHGDVTVPYTITDGDKTATSTVTIHVTPVNDAPVAMPDVVTTHEDTSITVDLTKNDSDIDGDKITVTDINGTPVTPGHEQTIVVDHSKIVIAHDGSTTFVPSDNYHGDVTVPYTITDGDKTATSQVTIHVTPVNDGPIAQDDTYKTDEDKAVPLHLTDNDSDVDGTIRITDIGGT
ncbi:tandem-95 repeat protein, partial [Photobacterium phosphoreum]